MAGNKLKDENCFLYLFQNEDNENTDKNEQSR